MTLVQFMRLPLLFLQGQSISTESLEDLQYEPRHLCFSSLKILPVIEERFSLVFDCAELDAPISHTFKFCMSGSTLAS
jgi:hypothetical protein